MHTRILRKICDDQLCAYCANDHREPIDIAAAF